MKNNYLMHHGIKGMRWGVRRFQNKDGSLTSAGRNRYGDGRAENGGHFSPTRNRGSKNSKGGRLTARDKREIAELDEVERAERRSDNQPVNFRPASKATIKYMKGLEKEARKADKQNRRQMERQAYDKWMSGKKLSDDEKRVLIGKKNPSEKALARFDKYTSGKIHQKTVNDYTKSKLTARDKREIAELDEVERAERRSDNQPANFRPASKATIKYMKGLEKEARKADKQNRRQMERQAYDKWMSGKKLSDDEKRVLIGKKNPSEKALARFDKYTSGKIHQKTVNDYTKSKDKKRELTPEEKQARKEKLIKGAKTAAAVLGTAAVVGGAVYAANKYSKYTAKTRADAENRLRELANREAERQRRSMPNHTSGTFTGSHANATDNSPYSFPLMNRTTSAMNRRVSSGHANASKAWTGEFADSYRAQSASVRAARNIQSRREANARRNSNNSDHTSGPFTGSFTGSRADARRSMKYGSAVTPRMNRGVTAMRSNDSVQRANARAAANTERARAALEEHMRRTGSRRR